MVATQSGFVSPIAKTNGNITGSFSMTTRTMSSSKSPIPKAQVKGKSKSSIAGLSSSPNVKSKKAMVSTKRMAPSEGEEKASSKRPKVLND